MNWNNKKVVVTGGASFIGSHLVEALVKLGSEVRVIDNFSSGDPTNLRDVSSSVEIVTGDLRNRTFAFEAIERGTEVVFHLAASHGGRGYIDTHPVECCDNMALDQTVFAASRRSNVERICFASSACVYPPDLQESGNGTFLSEDQASPTVKGRAYPDREYGWAKLMAEMTLAAYHREFGIKTSSVRIFSAYGERENETHAVTALIAKAFIGMDPYEIWGTGEEERNFTYVKDIVDALLRTAERVEDGTAVNAGTGERHKTSKVANMIFDLVGWRPSQVKFNPMMPVGVFSRTADLSYAKKLLDWSPQWSLKDGLSRTITWYYSTRNKAEVTSKMHSLLFENQLLTPPASR